jgi:hypothetical protein
VNTYRGWLNISKSSLRFKRRCDFIREKNFGYKKMSAPSPFEAMFGIFTFKIMILSKFEIDIYLKIYHQPSEITNVIILSKSSTRESFWTTISVFSVNI